MLGIYIAGDLWHEKWRPIFLSTDIVVVAVTFGMNDFGYNWLEPSFNEKIQRGFLRPVVLWLNDAFLLQALESTNHACYGKFLGVSECQALYSKAYDCDGEH